METFRNHCKTFKFSNHPGETVDDFYNQHWNIMLLSFMRKSKTFEMPFSLLFPHDAMHESKVIFRKKKRPTPIIV